MHTQISNYFIPPNKLVHYFNSFVLRCNYFYISKCKSSTHKILLTIMSFLHFFHRSVLKRRTKLFGNLIPSCLHVKRVGGGALSWVQHKQPCLRADNSSFRQTQLSMYRHILSHEDGNRTVLDKFQSLLITRRWD